MYEGRTTITKTISNVKAEHEETVAVLQRQVARERQIAVIRLHIIKALAIGLAITLVLIIVALATDFIDPDIGYFGCTPHN